MDSYLEIARAVLRSSRQPLSARQILNAAHQLQLVPRELYGRTQSKTLHARLATDILKRRSGSEFYRTGPGRFFLRSLRTDESVPARLRREYQAPVRSAQLGRFDVVAFPTTALADLTTDAIISIASLFALPWRFARLNDLRRDRDLIAFRFHLLLVADGRIFVDNRKPIECDDDIHHRSKIGVDGYIKRSDLSLFSSDGIGLVDAAVRVLLERFEPSNELISAADDETRWSDAHVVVGFDEHMAQPDLVAYLRFRCDGVHDLIRVIDAQSTSEWLTTPVTINDVGRFDKWSLRLLNDGRLQSALFG